MLYRYGQFVVDSRTRQVARDGVVLPISQRSYEILLFLIEKNGEIARKEEILAAVWPYSNLSGTNLTKQISLLRRSLHDESSPTEIIRTVPGVGYQIDKWEMTEPVNLPAHPPLNLQPVNHLEASGAGRMVADPPPAGRTFSAWRQRLIILVTLLLGIVGIALYLIVRLELNGVSGPSEVLDLRRQPGLKRDLGISPDGRRIAYFQADEQSGTGSVFIREIESGTVTEVASGQPADLLVAWGPDEEHLILVRPRSGEEERELIVLTLADRTEQRITAVREGGVDWAPALDSFVVCDRPGAVPAPNRLWLVSRDGLRRRLLTRLSPGDQMADAQPRFSPDGKTIAYLRLESGGVADIHLVDVDGGTPRRITTDRRRITDLEWTPDGREILFVSNRTGGWHLWRTAPQEGTRPRAVSRISDEVQNFSLTPDGTEIAFLAPPNDTVIEINPLPGTGISARLSLDSSAVPCRIDAVGYDHSPGFSPNGEKIAFISNQSGSEEVWIADSDCRNPRRITLLNGLGLKAPAWSPDGSRLAIEINLDGQSDLFEIIVEGGQPRQLTNSQSNERSPVWSPDGQWIYYTVDHDQPQIWKLPVNGVEILPINLKRAGSGQWTRDPDPATAGSETRDEVGRILGSCWKGAVSGQQ